MEETNETTNPVDASWSRGVDPVVVRVLTHLYPGNNKHMIYITHVKST